MNQRDIISVTFALFLLSIILLLFNIQKGEVQPWDEGLYAYRAREIVQTNQWWDQTPFALGKLYSATYPPLVPWAMALNMKIFGINLFAIRLFSVLCSSLIIVLFFYTFFHFFNYQIVFLFAVNLLLSSNYFYFSRQGITDIPLLFFVLLVFVLVYYFADDTKKIKKFIFGVGIVVFFAFALMTKIVVSFIPLISLPFIYKYCDKKKFYQVSLLFILGLIIALPWHIYMFSQYGWNFLSAFLPPHLFTVVESNSKQLGLLFYINQLIISNPLLILAFIYIYLRIKIYGFRKSFFTFNFFSDILYLWFISGLLIFSLAPTKLIHYSLYLLLPGLYLALEFIAIYFPKQSLKGKLLTSVLLLTDLMWSLSPNFRKSLKNLNFDDIFYHLAMLAIAIIALYAIYLIQKKKRNISILGNKFLESFIYLITVSYLIFVITQVSQKPTGKIFGGERIAKFLESHKVNNFVYLFHKVNDSDTLNPQLSWYTNGSFFGKDKTKYITFLGLELKGVDFNTLKKLSKFNNDIVVYYIYDYIPSIEATIREISKRRQVYLITPNYVIFGPEKPESKIQKEEILI